MDKHVTHYQQEKPKKPHPSAAERLRMGLAHLQCYHSWKSRAYLGLETDTDFQLFHLFSNFLSTVQVFTSNTITAAMNWALVAYFFNIFSNFYCDYLIENVHQVFQSAEHKQFNVLSMQYSFDY